MKHKLNRLVSNLNKKNASSKIHTWEDEHTIIIDLCSHGLESMDKLLFFKQEINWYTLDESDEYKMPLKKDHIHFFVSVDVCDDKNNTDILNTRNIVLKIKKSKDSVDRFNSELKRIEKFIRFSNMSN